MNRYVPIIIYFLVEHNIRITWYEEAFIRRKIYSLFFSVVKTNENIITLING